MVKKDSWLRFTTYNVYAVLLIVLFRQFKTIPILILETVRATSLLIAIAVIFIYMTKGIKHVWGMYHSMYPSWPSWTLLPYDWLLHFVPVMLMGLPSVLGSMTTGFLFIVVWYLLVKDRMKQLYVIPGLDYGLVVFGVLPLCVALYETILYL